MNPLCSVLLLALVAACHAAPAAEPAADDADNVCSYVPECPKKSNVLMPNPCPNGCQKYFECNKGKFEERACLPWENFHPTQLKCIPWDEVDCTWSEKVPTAAPTVAPKPTDAPAPAPSDGPAPEPAVPTLAPGCLFRPECPASGEVNMGIPCDKMCSSYVACKDGSYAKKDCSWPKKFDTESNRCVWYGANCAA